MFVSGIGAFLHKPPNSFSFRTVVCNINPMKSSLTTQVETAKAFSIPQSKSTRWIYSLHLATYRIPASNLFDSSNTLLNFPINHLADTNNAQLN